MAWGRFDLRLRDTEPPFAYNLLPIAGGGYEVVIYEEGKYISRRYFTNISDAADFGENYCWGLNYGSEE